MLEICSCDDVKIYFFQILVFVLFFHFLSEASKPREDFGDFDAKCHYTREVRNTGALDNSVIAGRNDRKSVRHRGYV